MKNNNPIRDVQQLNKTKNMKPPMPIRKRNSICATFAAIAGMALASIWCSTASAQLPPPATSPPNAIEGVDIAGNTGQDAGQSPYAAFTMILGFGYNVPDVVGNDPGGSYTITDNSGNVYGLDISAPPRVDDFYGFANNWVVYLTVTNAFDVTTPGRYYVIAYTNLTCNGGSPCYGIITNYINGSILVKHFSTPGDTTSDAWNFYTNNSIFLNNQSDQEFVEQAAEQQEHFGQYGQQYLGYFRPPVSGNYTFAIDGDGGSFLNLSTDSTYSNQVTICNNTHYSSMRSWVEANYGNGDTQTYPPNTPAISGWFSAPIYLASTNKYFLQAVFKGPDNPGKNFAITWTSLDPIPGLPAIADQFTPQSAGLIPWEITNGWVAVATNSIVQSGGLSLTINASVVLAPSGATFQWYSNNVAIGGATNRNYYKGVTFQGTDSGTYRLVATTVSPVLNFTSPPVAVAIGPVLDVTPPLLSFMWESNDTLIVTYDKAMNPSDIVNPANYKVGGVALPAFLSTSVSPENTTAYLQFTTPYYLTNMTIVHVSGVHSVAGTAIVTTNFVTLDPQVTVLTYWEPGMTTSGNLADLFSFPDYVNNTPAIQSIYPRLEQGATNGPFGMQMLAYLQPTETANYTFYIGSDGQSQLLLSTDDTTNNAVVICYQPQYDNVREWISDQYNGYNPNLAAPLQPTKVSAPISLLAGQKYYLEVDYMGPGNGNKNVSVQWTDDSGATTNYPAPVPLGLLDGTTPQSLGLMPYTAYPTFWWITPTSDANGTISPASQVLVPGGGSTNFSITPNVGYVIGNVTIDGVSQGAISSYTFSNVYALHTISATFNLYMPPTAPSFIGPISVQSGHLVMVTATQLGYNYYLLQTTSLNPPVQWTTNSIAVGTGGNITNTPAVISGQPKMFYRYMAQ